MDIKKETQKFLGVAKEFIKPFADKFAQSKNKASLVLSFIFIGLIIFGLFVFICNLFGGRRIRAGFLEVSGRIEGYEYHAGTKVAGKVDKMFVEEGQEVKKGDPIGHIHSKQLEALAARAQARLKEAKANLNLAQLEYKRYGRLFEESAIPKMEYDRVETNYKSALEEAVAAEKQFEKAKADLNDTLIAAPISGTVVIKIVRPGEVVAVGTPLVNMISLDNLYLKVFLATDFAGKVKFGDEAKVFPDALKRDSFDAYVDKICPKAEFTPKNVETKSQRAKLVFQIKLKIKKNTEHKLKPGMPCNGVIKIKDKASWRRYRRR
jgi:HlyD family secretion protein